MSPDLKNEIENLIRELEEKIEEFERELENLKTAQKLAMIPANAISSLAAPNGSSCPAGFIRSPFYLSGGSNLLCLIRFAASNRTRVIADLKILNPGSACPAGYEKAADYSYAGNLQPVCVKYQAAAAADRFLTNTYMWYSCVPGDTQVGTHPFAPNAIAPVHCASFRGTGLPDSVVTDFTVRSYTGFPSQYPPNGQNAYYTQVALGYVSGGAPDQHWSIWAQYSPLAAASQIVTDIRLPGNGMPCPAGFTQNGVFVNPNDPGRGSPLCQRLQPVAMADKAVTFVYPADGNDNCLAGDGKVGTMYLYISGTPTTATPRSLCASY